MASRIMEQQQATDECLVMLKSRIPTWQDIYVLESVQAAVGPLADSTDMLSVEQLVTVSSI